MSPVVAFLIRVLLFVFPLMLVIIYCSSYMISSDVDPFCQYLYRYQISKLSSRNDVDTFFFGDSSLGNAIDVEHFGELTGATAMNLALTGFYGYAGSYNMLKKALRVNPDIQNVIVIQIVDTMKFPIEYRGYLHTIDSINDILELEYAEIRELLNVAKDPVFRQSPLLWLKNTIRKSHAEMSDSLISHDYIKQGSRLQLHEEATPFSIDFNKKKIKFLLKIKKLCEEKGMNFMYLHGTKWKLQATRSFEYINAVNAYLKEHDIPVIEEYVWIETEHIGDTDNHVLPSMKKFYTRKFSAILAPYLIVRGEKTSGIFQARSH